MKKRGREHLVVKHDGRVVDSLVERRVAEFVHQRALAGRLVLRQAVVPDDVVVLQPRQEPRMLPHPPLAHGGRA
eukprot:5764384-Pyramimonas_sp.AAC.1